jgi:spore coat protein H
LTIYYRFVFIAMRVLLPIFVFALFTSSCYREVMYEEADADRFELSVSPDKQNFIYASRDTSYSIEDPELSLQFNGEQVSLTEIRVRGKSATRYQRKSYVVFVSDPIRVVDRSGSGVKELSRFKLIALAMDYTYIENRVAFGLLEEAGVMPLFFKFVEFRINGNTQGVYLLIEDPEAYYQDIGSEYIIRRGYNHTIDDTDYFPSSHFIPYNTYESRYKQVYSSLVNYQGEELKRVLAERLSLELYFRKMGIDYLIQNGDYTDELYLYSRVEEDNIRFYPIPWDYDDIFSNAPHELNRSWGMGTLFGKRFYETMDDIYGDVGETLVYSIEDDLDYTIAKDPVLYRAYTSELKRLFQDLDREVVEQVFAETERELTTFYNSVAVIEQSQYDQDMATIELWMANMADKKAFIIHRLEEIKQQLDSL